MKGSYEYKRFMRDGSIKLITAVIRSKQEKKIARRSNPPR